MLTTGFNGMLDLIIGGCVIEVVLCGFMFCFDGIVAVGLVVCCLG